MKISAIDIGSNSVRLATFAGGKTLYKRIETTRLGEGLNLSGRLKPEAIERSACAVKKFLEVAKADGAERVYAFATAAVRSAVNGGEFCGRVLALCGIEVEVLSGEAEAEIGLSGALRGRDGGVIDVGGASTEVCVKSDGKLRLKSFDMGAVRLYDIAGRDLNKLRAAVSQALEGDRAFDIGGCGTFAIGGTATTLASLKHGLAVYDPAVTDGTRLPLREIEETADKLISLPVGEVRSLAGMDARRADIIGGGALLLAEVMKKFQVFEITVSESDNLEGYVIRKEGKL